MGSFDLRLLCFLGQVPEDILVERVVGRRLDPVTGNIYHLKCSPPETEEIAARLTNRFDDIYRREGTSYLCLCVSRKFSIQSLARFDDTHAFCP